MKVRFSTNLPTCNYANHTRSLAIPHLRTLCLDRPRPLLGLPRSRQLSEPAGSGLARCNPVYHQLTLSGPLSPYLVSSCWTRRQAAHVQCDGIPRMRCPHTCATFFAAFIVTASATYHIAGHLFIFSNRTGSIISRKETLMSLLNEKIKITLP